MTMPVTLRADQCPPVPTPGQYPASAFTVAGVATAPTAPVSEALNYGTGGPIQTPGIWNRNAAHADLLARFGGGCWAVAEGLTLSAGTGLQVSVSPGHAVIDGVVETTAPLTVAVADNARSWIWLVRGVPGGTPTPFAQTAPTPPASPCVLLGSVLTASGAVASVDGSGVLRLAGPTPTRYTADAGAPADAPPADVSFAALTAGGEFRWNGAAYTGGAKAQTLVVGASHNVTLTPGTDYRIGWDFSAGTGGGTFADDLYAQGLRCPSDAALIIENLEGQKATGKAFFHLHYPGTGSDVTLAVTPKVKGTGFTGTVLTGLAGAWDAPAAIG